MTVATIYNTASQYGKLQSNKTAQQLRLIKFDLNSVSQQAIQEGDLDRKASRQTTTQVQIPTITSNSTSCNGEKMTKVYTSTPVTGRVSTLLEEYADVFEGVGHLKESLSTTMHLFTSLPWEVRKSDK
jgi:hypothetical protein